MGNVAWLRGDLAMAHEYYSRALAIKQRLAPNSLNVASTLDNLGLVVRDRGDLAAAQDYHHRALAINERLAPESLDVATSLDNLGIVARERNDLMTAQDYHSRALAIRERLAPDSLDVAGSLAAKGELAARAGHFVEARSLFSRAVTIVEAQRRQISSTEARALLLARHTEPLVGLLRSDLALNDGPAAFATLERARARSMVELLAERRLDWRADAPADLLTEQDDLDKQRSAASTALNSALTELTTTRGSLSKVDSDNERDRMSALKASIQTVEERIETLREDLARHAARQRELEARIWRSSPRLAALKYPEPLDLEGAQAALDAGTLLLAYLVDDEKTYLFAATKTDLNLFTLPVGRTVLRQRVNVFRELVAKQRLGNFSEAGQQLYDTLIRPAQDWMDRAQRVLICPDGPLQVLPFAALVSQPEPKLRYLIEDKPMHTVASMTVYAETRKWATDRLKQLTNRNAPQDWKVLAFGDPVYTKEQAAAIARAPALTASAEQADQTQSSDAEASYLRRRGLSLAPLPRTRDEVEAIVELFGKSATARLGLDATETSAKLEAKDADIIHLASHGWMDEAMGLSSGLALTQPEALGRKPTAEDDGLLQAWEIFEHVRLKADLVVLSACQTGLGEDVRGEGLVGLTRAFLYAGARSVMVSLWDVSDGATAEFMKEFYRQLRDGTTKDAALQRAMIAMQGNPAHRHPFYWAPFILVGDWQ